MFLSDHDPRREVRRLATGRLFLTAVVCYVLELMLRLLEIPDGTSDAFLASLVDNDFAGVSLEALEVMGTAYEVGWSALWIWGAVTAVGLIMTLYAARSAGEGTPIGTAGLAILRVQKIAELCLSILLAVGLVVAVAIGAGGSIVLALMAGGIIMGAVGIAWVLPTLLALDTIRGVKEIFEDGQTLRRSSVVLVVYCMVDGIGRLASMAGSLWAVADDLWNIVTMVRIGAGAASQILFGVLLVQFQSGCAPEKLAQKHIAAGEN